VRQHGYVTIVIENKEKNHVNFTNETKINSELYTFFQEMEGTKMEEWK